MSAEMSACNRRYFLSGVCAGVLLTLALLAALAALLAALLAWAPAQCVLLQHAQNSMEQALGTCAQSFWGVLACSTHVVKLNVTRSIVRKRCSK